MNTNNFLRNRVLSGSAFVCAVFLFAVTFAVTSAVPASGQTAQRSQASAPAHLQYVVFDGSTRAGWYSFPGQQPKLRFHGDEVRITSRTRSTVLLSRVSDPSATGAEVSLMQAPISTSSISGLAVMSDAQHAMVIGLEGGSVVLWQLDPSAARMVARHPVNSNSKLEFKVTRDNSSDVRFFWRHLGGAAWHPLGNGASNKTLSGWSGPLNFGLLLDGPRGSEATFSNYRSGSAETAWNSAPAMVDSTYIGQ